MWYSKVACDCSRRNGILSSSERRISLLSKKSSDNLIKSEFHLQFCYNCRVRGMLSYLPVSILSLWLPILSFTNDFLERYGFSGFGLKTGVKNDIFWSEIGSRFGEPGGTPPPRIPRRTPGVYVTYDKSAETLATQTRLIKIVTLNGIFTLKRSFVICQQFPTFLQKLNGWHM